MLELQQKNIEAIECYEKALAIDSNHQLSLIHLALLYHKQGSRITSFKYSPH